MTITSSECNSIKTWKSGIVPYFCGDTPECEYPSEKALAVAIKNLNEKFLLVGLTEEFENFIKILEKMMPAYFSDLFYNFEGEFLILLFCVNLNKY